MIPFVFFGGFRSLDEKQDIESWSAPFDGMHGDERRGQLLSKRIQRDAGRLVHGGTCGSVGISRPPTAMATCWCWYAGAEPVRRRSLVRGSSAFPDGSGADRAKLTENMHIDLMNLADALLCRRTISRSPSC